MWFKNLFIVFVVALVLVSCTESKRKGQVSTGRGSEIIVVCNKAKWDGAIGDSIRSLLMRPMLGLPENEPEFTLIYIPEKNFSKFLQPHHNVLFIDINPGISKSKVETLKNVWSSPQRVIKIKASSDTAFLAEFSKHSESIRTLFNQNEYTRFATQNALNRNVEVEKLLLDKFGIKMVISNDFYKAKEMSDFVWLRSETNANSLGLMIYTFPYKDTLQLDPGAILTTREKYTKLYIPGPANGSYMSLEREIIPPVSKQIVFKRLYAVETRGLWKTVGDFMGGPFVNYTIVDAPRQRIIVMDGYVYYPNKSKRNYIRQLESIIWGATFTDPKLPQTK